MSSGGVAGGSGASVADGLVGVSGEPVPAGGVAGLGGARALLSLAKTS